LEHLYIYEGYDANRIPIKSSAKNPSVTEAVRPRSYKKTSLADALHLRGVGIDPHRKLVGLARDTFQTLVL